MKIFATPCNSNKSRQLLLHLCVQLTLGCLAQLFKNLIMTIILNSRNTFCKSAIWHTTPKAQEPLAIVDNKRPGTISGLQVTILYELDSATD